MYSTIIFLSISIILLSIMLVIDIEMEFDTSSLDVNVSIRIFRLPILKVDIGLSTLHYRINHGKENKLIQIIGEEEKYLISQIKSSILDKLYYDRVKIDCVIGGCKPDMVAMLVGALSGIMNLFIFVSNAKGSELTIEHSIKGDFDTNNSIVKMNIRVLITIFDLIYGILFSLYRRGKYAKQK